MSQLDNVPSKLVQLMCITEEVPDAKHPVDGDLFDFKKIAILAPFGSDFKRKLKSVVFTQKLTQPALWSRDGVLGKALNYDYWLSRLGGFQQETNSVDKNLKKSTGTLPETPKQVRINHEVVIAMKIVLIFQQLASDAVRWQEDK